MMARVMLSLLCFLLLSSCMSIGPATIARDRFDYVSAISDSWKNQMLLNIVKLRYADVPVFLEVASVISQYGWEGIINFSLGWNFPVPGTDSQSFGGTGRYAERPTITYTPLTGERFTKSLLTPIPPPAMLFLLQAGWPVKFLFRTCLRTINDIDNLSSSAIWSRKEDVRFGQLLNALERIQQAGGLAVRIEQQDKRQATLVVFRRKVNAAIQKDREIASRLLDLNPSVSEYRVVYGAVAANDREIAMLTRSILEIMIEMASLVETPESRSGAKQSLHSAPPAATSREAGISFRAHCSAHKPEGAFVAIKYRDRWYWVGDKDRSSKVTFTFLMILFSLVETGGTQGSPILTVPIN